MGIFKKKSDPISDRAKALQAEIAALESQIKRLANEPPKPSPPPPSKVVPMPGALGASPEKSPPAQAASTPPARSAAPTPAHSSRRPESIFESVSHQRVTSDPAKDPQSLYNADLGVRKYDLGAAWRKLLANFRGPPANNPKLVNYLAAGSIQGLRPLRYEKRVARNRFLFLFFGLLFLLIGIVSFFFKHR
ncbi:MAG TPA: hypothetical protein VHH73_05940 [Verrucomicrobiae bacterium]|nr:hypothetical protein [Verrucomicrobiae bacterium]